MQRDLEKGNTAWLMAVSFV